MHSVVLPSVNDYDTAYRRNQLRSIRFLILLGLVLAGKGIPLRRQRNT